jgi:hypothetical protein
MQERFAANQTRAGRSNCGGKRWANSIRARFWVCTPWRQFSRLKGVYPEAEDLLPRVWKRLGAGCSSQLYTIAFCRRSPK